MLVPETANALVTPYDNRPDASMIQDEEPGRMSYSISEEEINEMRLHIMELEERRQDYEIAIQELGQALEEAKVRREEAEAKAAEAAADYDGAAKALVERDEAINQLSRDLGERVINLQNEIEQEKSDRAVLQEKLNADHKSALEDIRDQFSREKALIIDKHALNLRKRDAEIASNQQQIARLNEEVQNRKDSLNDNNERICQLEEELHVHFEKKEESRVLILELQAKNSSLEASITAANKKLETNTAALENVVTSVKNKLADGVSRFQKILGNPVEFQEVLKSNNIDLDIDTQRSECPKSFDVNDGSHSPGAATKQEDQPSFAIGAENVTSEPGSHQKEDKPSLAEAAVAQKVEEKHGVDIGAEANENFVDEDEGMEDGEELIDDNEEEGGEEEEEEEVDEEDEDGEEEEVDEVDEVDEEVYGDEGNDSEDEGVLFNDGADILARPGLISERFGGVDYFETEDVAESPNATENALPDTSCDAKEGNDSNEERHRLDPCLDYDSDMDEVFPQLSILRGKLSQLDAVYQYVMKVIDPKGFVGEKSDENKKMKDEECRMLLLSKIRNESQGSGRESWKDEGGNVVQLSKVNTTGELTRLEKLLEETTSALESLEKDKAALELELNAKRSQVEETERSLDEVSSSLAKSQSENQMLRDQLREKDALFSEKVQTLEALEQKNESLSNDINQAEKRLQELDSAMKKLEANRADLEASETRWREESQSKSEQLLGLKDHVSRLEKELDGKRLEKEQDNNAENQEEMSAVLVEMENTIQALKLTISTLTTEKQRISESLQYKHDELTLLKGKNIETLESYAKNLKHIEELSDEKERITAEYESLKSDYQQAQENLNKLESQVKQLSNSNIPEVDVEPVDALDETDHQDKTDADPDASATKKSSFMNRLLGGLWASSVENADRDDDDDPRVVEVGVERHPPSDVDHQSRIATDQEGVDEDNGQLLRTIKEDIHENEADAETGGDGAREVARAAEAEEHAQSRGEDDEHVETDSQGVSKMSRPREEPQPQDSRKRRKRDNKDNTETSKEDLGHTHAIDEGDGLRSNRPGGVETSENVHSISDTGKTYPSEEGTDAALTNDDADGATSKGTRKKRRSSRRVAAKESSKQTASSTSGGHTRRSTRGAANDEASTAVSGRKPRRSSRLNQKE